jgi:hypothetical protein
MKKRLFLILPAVIVAALLGGCCGAGGGSNYLYPTQAPSGAPTPTIGLQVEPQQLIDRKTAETLVGNALKDMEDPKVKPNSDPAMGMSFCLYDSAVDGGRFMQIALYKRTEQFNTDPTLIFNALRSPASNASAPPVIATAEGIGDSAYIADPGIHIMYQGYYIVISVGDPKNPANQEVLKSAGSAAVAQLKTLLGIQ